MSTHIIKQNKTITEQGQTIEELNNTLKHLREQTHSQLTLITEIIQKQKEEQIIQQITSDSITSLITNCILECKNLYKEESIIKSCKQTQIKVTQEIKDKFNKYLQLQNIEVITDPNEQITNTDIACLTQNKNEIGKTLEDKKTNHDGYIKNNSS